MIKNKFNENLFIDIFSYSFLIILSASTLLPFMNVLSKAVSSESAIISGRVGILPVGFQIDTLKYVITSMEFIRSFVISVGVTVVGSLLALLMTAIAAYPLSKKNIKGVKTVLILYVITMLFNPGIIPNYLLIRNLNLLNKLSALVLPTMINVFNLLIIKSYYESLPEGLEEAAIIDGASYVKVLFKIILPLSKPVLATIGLFYVVSYWNDYFHPMLYLTSAKLKTLQLYLRDIVIEVDDSALNMEKSIDELMNLTPDGIRSATIIAATVPVLVVYPFLQKYFIKGMLIGSVKG